MYSKTCLKQPLKEKIAECRSKVLQNASLSCHLSLRPLFCLFLSGRLRPVLLYFRSNQQVSVIFSQAKEPVHMTRYLSHGQPSDTQDSLHIYALQSILKCLLFTHTEHSSRRRQGPKFRPIAQQCSYKNDLTLYLIREGSGSVVECLTQGRGAVGSSLTGVIALWLLSKTHLS